MTSTIGGRIYHKKHTQPYLKQHAAITAFLYHDTCVLSGMDVQKLENNVLKVGMTPLSDQAVPPNSYGRKQMFGRWEIEADTFFKEEWKYKPYPYEISLSEREFKRGGDKYGIPKLSCVMHMGNGVKIKTWRRSSSIQII